MKINSDLIKSFNPCKDLFDNYVGLYAKRVFSIDEFSELSGITDSCKIWVLCRLLNQDDAVVFCLDCAFRSLDYAAYDAADAAYYAAAAAAADAAYDAAAYAAYAADAAWASRLESIEVLKTILKG